MAFDDDRAAGTEVEPREPSRTALRRILDEQPEQRHKLGRAIAALGLTMLVALVAIGGLLIWHLRRRGKRVREGLAPSTVSRGFDAPEGTSEHEIPWQAKT